MLNGSFNAFADDFGVAAGAAGAFVTGACFMLARAIAAAQI